MVSIRPHTLIFSAILLVGLVFILPFSMTLLVSAITAYVLYPLVHGLQKFVRIYNLALILSLLIIILPFAMFFKYVAGDVTPILHEIQSFSGEINTLLEFARIQLSAFGLGEYALGIQDVISKVTDYLIAEAQVFVRNIPSLLLNIAIYIFATYHFIKDGGSIVGYINEFIDSIEKEEQVLFRSIMTGLKKSFDVLFISYVAMAAVTAVLAWMGFYVLGVPYAAFLGLLCGIFAFLPIFGVWMVYIPAAIYEYTIGNINSAIYVVLYGVLILTLFTDFAIRPALGVRKTGVSPLTIFLGFFSGPAIMGASGVIIGPIVFVLVETVLKEYIDFVVADKRAAKSSRTY